MFYESILQKNNSKPQTTDRKRVKSIVKQTKAGTKEGVNQ